MSWNEWLPATQGWARREIERQLKNLWSYALDQTDHITRIGEITMARVDELRARLAAATDELARDLEDLRGRLAAQDEALAAELEPMVARLEAMGADPENPVPDAEPVTSDGGAAGGSATDELGNPLPADGSTEVVNPTPGAEDNPDNR